MIYSSMEWGTNIEMVLNVLSGFSLGASSIALFTELEGVYTLKPLM